MKKLLYLILFSLIFITSCKKEKDTSLTGTPTFESGKPINLPNTTYRASKEELARFEANFIAKAKQKSVPQARGVCTQIVSSEAKVREIVDSDGCGTSGTYTVLVRYYVYQIAGNNYGDDDVDFTFTLMGFPFTDADLVDEGVILPPGGCPDWLFDGTCEFVRWFEYEFDNIDDGYGNLPAYDIDITSAGPLCSTQNTNGYTPFVIDDLEYTSSPADIYIFIGPASGSINVATGCGATACTPPWVQCNTGGYFKYRVQGTSTFTTVYFTSPFTYNLPITGLSTGIVYEYECQLTYSFGNSLIRTGTFTP